MIEIRAILEKPRRKTGTAEYRVEDINKKDLSKMKKKGFEG